MRRRVAIIGGGITGLAAANRLRELAPHIEVVVLEAGDQLGGVIRTSQHGGFLMEGAADGFMASPPAAIDLCQRLGLEDELIEANESCRQALVLRGSRLLPVPMGFQLMAPGRLGPLLATPILSVRGKLRAALELCLPARTDGADESLQSFICRRFGREIYERLVQPLVGGIYAGDPRQLSIEATFPRFRQMELQHGSLTRVLLRSQSEAREGGGARYGQFKTFRGGMKVLVDALATRLTRHSIMLNSPVKRLIACGKDRWSIQLGAPRSETIDIDGVIIATPAHQSARMLRYVDPYAADELRSIEYASCAVVSLGYRREQINHPLNGFGFVVPLVEQRMILSCSFASVKYAARSPDDCVLLRVFIGGACQSGLLCLSSLELGQLAASEVSSLLRIRGQPVVERVVRQHQAMPQYNVGHCQLVERVDTRLRRFRTLALAGSALYGVGIPRCIETAELAAERIAKQLPTAYPSGPRTKVPLVYVNQKEGIVR